MQFERIRKNHKRKIIIGGLILVCVISAITITTTRAKYKLVEDIPLVRGYINYIADKEKPIITNVTTTVTKTEINVSVTASDNVGVTEYWYQIGTNTAVKGTGNTHKFTGLFAGTTYTIKVYVKDAAGNQSDTTTKSVTTSSPTSEDTLTKLNISDYNTTTPDFSNTESTDRGIYRKYDGMYGGYSYYWRGDVTNNYVKFANFYWRIIRINGDGTIRLIFDYNKNGNATLLTAKYHTLGNQSNHVGWTYSGTSQRTLSGTASNAKTQLESWYASNIGNSTTYSSKIADGKYCNDRDVKSGNTWVINGSSFSYAVRERIESTKNPTLSCLSGDVYTLKVGLITADEVLFAKTKYNLYYLSNGANYWTMSPSDWVYNNGVRMFFVHASGTIDSGWITNANI